MTIENNRLIKVENKDIPKSGEFIIPNNITEICHDAFRECFSLVKVKIPYGIKKIENFTFWRCTSLEEIEIPNSVTEIGACAFYYCKSLKEIVIPSNVKKINDGAFLCCISLEKIIIQKGVLGIGTRAFSECKKIKEIIIPNSVTEIGDQAFGYCISLTKIIIPDSVIKIGVGAFENCNSLESAVISSNVTIMERWTFSGCKSLKGIVIPNGVIEIGAEAFINCDSLKGIVIPFSNNIKQIGSFVFKNCQELKHIDIPKSIIYISCYAFNNSNISNLNIRTSLFTFEHYFIESLIKNNIYSLTIYNKKIDLEKKEIYDYIDYERIRKNFELTMYDIRKQELLDIIKNELNKNGIIRKRNISYKEHKDIIDDVLRNLQYAINMKHYDYRSVLNPYLEKYIEVHKPKNVLIQLNGNINIFQNKSIDDVIKDLKEWKIELLNDNEKYIDIFNYGKGMNEYPLYISSIFYDTVSKYSKDIKIKQIKQVFDKLTSSGKNNLFKKIFFKTNDDNNLVLDKELLEQLNSFINNEIILASEEIKILNKIKELINNYIGKLQEYISYLNNYSINADNSLDTFSKSDELLKGAVKDSKIQDFNHSITSISEKYGQINLVISNNLIYVNKLNNIKNSLLPTLLEKIMTSDVVAKDIEIVKETMQISKMLEEMIINKENISNNLEDNNELDKDKQFVKKNN